MNRRILIVALFFLALGAFSLHSRIHQICVEKKQPAVTATEIVPLEKHFQLNNFFAGFFSFLDLVLVTWLFCSKRTAGAAFMLNGMFCIIGTILMAHFTMAQLWGNNASLMDWLYMKSTLADIVILGADFLVGKAVYDSYQGILKSSPPYDNP